MAPQLLLAASLLILLPPAFATHPGARFDVIHVDSDAGRFSTTEWLRRATQRGRHHATELHGKGTNSRPGIRSRVRWTAGQYLISLAIGTPGVPFLGVADTGSDLTWTQCQPCIECLPQSTPVYDPSRSSTFSLLECSSPMCQALPELSRNCTQSCAYRYVYQSNASTQGTLATETLTFLSDHPAAIGGVAFGCSNANAGYFYNSTGVVGLGRGALSLVSQLGYGKFSYCLTSYYDSSHTSPLLFGSMADLGSSPNMVQSTPLAQSPFYPSFYYVKLQGISIAKTRVPVQGDTFKFKSDGTGGTIIDSGSPITYLEKTAYKSVKEHVVSIVGLKPTNGTVLGVFELDLCFSLPSGALPDMPDMVLHFEGANMTLPRDKYMLFDPRTGFFCLAFGVLDGLSILGNYQQQNFHVLFDIVQGLVSFVPAECSKL